MMRHQKIFSEEQPLLSVGIPAWNAAPISWLSFAGLARQTGVEVPWEIVVCQEDDSVSEEMIEEFGKELAESGCVKVLLFQLPEWIHLSSKWRVIRDHVSASSEVFLLQGVDDYPHRTRLASSWRAFCDQQVDWFHWDDLLFYDLNFESWSMFRGSMKPRLTAPVMGWKYHPCNPNMATRTSYLKYLPEEKVRRGVDGWMFYSIQRGLGRRPAVVSGDPDESLTGFGTTGFNSLSLSRIKMGRLPSPPLFKVEFSLDEIVPVNEAELLRSLGNHSRRRALDTLVVELERTDRRRRVLRDLLGKVPFSKFLVKPLRFLTGGLQEGG